MQNLASIFDTTRFWATRVSKWSKISGMWNKYGECQCMAQCPLQLRWSSAHASLRTVWEMGSVKNWTAKMCKLSITWPRIVRFRSKFVQSLNTWRQIYYQSSRSRAQRSMAQREIRSQQQKNAINRQCSNLVKIMPEPSATRDTHSLGQILKIAITCRGLLNFAEMVQNFITAQSVYCKCSRLKGRGQGHNVNQWRSSKFRTGERTEVLFLSLPILSFSLVSPSFPAPPLPLPFLPVLFP